MTRALIVLLLLTTSAARGNPYIDLETTGGDAWTFTLDIAGRATREKCDEVTIESPLGTTRALLTGDRFDARIVLRGGENRVAAVCSKHNRAIGRSEPQIWRLRLADVPKAWARVRAFGTSISLDAGG